MIDITRLKPQIDRICQELPVKRLGVFGSALARDFRPESDVDVLVVFDEDSRADLFDKYFELKERLEEVFEREVDLVVDRPFKNPVFKASVERSRIVIYER
jgi:predicted nucleotidyltransferase